MTIDLNSTLKTYIAKEAEAERSVKPKTHHPILILQTKDGVKELTLIEDRKQIPWYNRALAFFGLGNASLKNVRDYLDKYKTEISEDNIKALEIIDSKIELRNQSSRIQRINPIKLDSFLVKGTYGSYVGSTYDPQSDDDGIIDFAHVFPEQKLAYIADGTSHGVSDDKRRIFAALWHEFNKDIAQLPHSSSPQECQTKLNELRRQQSKRFEDKGTASTLIIAQLVKGSDEKTYLAHVAVGDSDLFLLRANGDLVRIIPKGDDSRTAELSGDVHRFHAGHTEVQPGDKIVAVTDGITDFMSEEVLKSVLLANDTTPTNVGEKLLDRLNEGSSGGTKELNSSDKHKSDDISVFMMTVT